jgi:hypothetical protein
MAKYLDDILWIGGSVLIVLGVGMIYIPAAFIFAGIALIAAGVMVAKVKNNVIAKSDQ